MTYEKIESIVKKMLSEKRFRHTLGCAETAVHLARRWGADEQKALRAALLHDITKEMPYEEQLGIVENAKLCLSDIEKSRNVIHAFSGAVVAHERFGEDDDVCRAVMYHTTACKDMKMLDRIIWLSDLTEKNRDFPGVEEIRKTAETSLAGALILGYDRTIEFLIERGSLICENIILARNSELLRLESERGNCK